MSRTLALVPAALLAAGAFWTGGFETAARFPNGPAGELALLVAVLAAARELPDPLRLGRLGALWAPALVAVAAASWAASPLPRAGRTGLVLLPAFLLLPGAAARCWGDEGRRRLGLATWSAVVAAVGLAGLLDSAGGGWSRAAAPLGHHNLLGAFLAATLPVAALGLRERGAARSAALAATALGGGALAASRSLGAVVALSLVALALAFGLRRGRELVLGLGLLGLGLAVPRLEAIARGEDPSARARAAYAEAALEGAAERRLLGWGPGAVSWTIAGFLSPRPGANPAGELVGEPHSTPLRIAYELGAAGGVAVLGLLLAFARARWRERGSAPDRALLVAGAAGCAAVLLAGLAGSWLTVPAVPLALALAAGAGLAGGAPPPARPAAAGAAAVALYLAAALAVQVPAALARRDYERARSATGAAARDAALAAAVARDPDFPLYRARLAWQPAAGARGATGTIEAARAALGVAPLWLRAGFLALGSESPGLAQPALARAMALDPLSGGAPFGLFVVSGGSDLDCAARALAAEPALAAATYWRGHESARVAAIERLREWGGLDANWVRSFAARAVATVPAAAGPEVDLVYRVDGTPAVSASLHLFRRTPWPEELMRIRLDREAAAALRLPPASSLAGSSRDAFPPRRCAP